MYEMAVTTAALSPSSSDVSLVSLDPGIVREISKIQSSSRDRSHQDRLLRRGQTLKEKANANYDNLPQRSTSTRQTGRPRARTNSLRHVKNSTEMLKQKSLRRKQDDSILDSSATLKGGRHFTVGNVGNNGRIYLR